MKGNNRILIMAGGTGGHVYPALAVASELRERGYRVEWVGTRRGLEHRVAPEAGFTLHYLAVRGVRGKGVSDRIMGFLLLAVASLQALWLVLRTWPACVVGMGGYVAGPAGVAAWLLRRPLLIHEQNAVAGTTNRMLAPLASKVVAGFYGAFSNGTDVSVLGNPVRADLIAAAESADYDYDGERAMRLLVLVENGPGEGQQHQQGGGQQQQVGARVAEAAEQGAGARLFGGLLPEQGGDDPQLARADPQVVEQRQHAGRDDGERAEEPDWHGGKLHRPILPW